VGTWLVGGDPRRRSEAAMVAKRDRDGWPRCPTSERGAVGLSGGRLGRGRRGSNRAIRRPCPSRQLWC